MQREIPAARARSGAHRLALRGEPRLVGGRASPRARGARQRGAPAMSRKSSVAVEGEHLLDRGRRSSAHGPRRPARRARRKPRSISAGGERKSPISTSFERAAIERWRRQRRRAGAGVAARISAKRSMTSRAAIGRDSPSRPTRSPPRTARSASASVSTAARSSFAARREVGAEVHRSPSGRTTATASAPPPIRARARKPGARAPSGASRCGRRARRRRTGGTARNSRRDRRAGARARRACTLCASRRAGDDEVGQAGRKRRRPVRAALRSVGCVAIVQRTYLATSRADHRGDRLALGAGGDRSAPCGA